MNIMKFKKLLLTSLVMGSISFIGLGSKVYAMTAEEGVRWAENSVGKKYGSGQCVALIQKFAKDNFGHTVRGDAIELKESGKFPRSWQVVSQSRPKRGDIAIWSHHKHPHGHVGIATSDADHKGNFTSVEQNVNEPNIYKGGPAKEMDRNIYHDKNDRNLNYWGYIRPPYERKKKSTSLPIFYDSRTGITILPYEHQTPSEEK